MSEQTGLQPRPLAIELPVFPDWRHLLLAMGGSVTRAAAYVAFKENDMEVAVRQAGRELEPREYPWAQPDRGTLFVGCHRNGAEAFFLAALVGKEERDKVLTAYSKPYGLLAKGLGRLAVPTTSSMSDLWKRERVSERILGMVLPVVSQKLDRDRPTRLTNVRDRCLWWAGMMRRLPDAEAIASTNTTSRTTIVNCIETSGAGLIFPTGHIGDAATGTWRRGVADVALHISPERQAQTDIVPFRFDEFSARSLAFALLRGRPVANKRIGLELAPTYTVQELIETAGADIDAMTAHMQKQYRDHFAAQ